MRCRSAWSTTGLCGLEAEFDQEPGGIEAMARLGVGKFAVHGGDEETDDETAVLGFLGDDVSETEHIF